MLNKAGIRVAFTNLFCVTRNCKLSNMKNSCENKQDISFAQKKKTKNKIKQK